MKVLFFIGLTLLISCSKGIFKTSNSKLSDSTSKAFISTWRTTTSEESITLPLREGFEYDAEVDWGDGTTGQITSFDDPDATHVYAEPGDYKVQINGIFQTIYFNDAGDRTKIISVENLGSVDWRSFENAFRGCTELISVSGGDVSKVTSMARMFRNATKFSQGNIANWDTSKVQSARSMFENAESFNLAIDQWDTSSLVDMGLMFHNARAFNGAIGNWNTSNVETMQWTFRGASSFNQPLPNWDTKKVKNMHSLFKGSSVILPSTFNQSIAHFDVSSVETMNQMFEDNPVFNQDISGWDTSMVKEMSYMFRRAYGFNQNIGQWDVSSVTHAYDMFKDATSFNQDLKSWVFAPGIQRTGFSSGATSWDPNFIP